MLAPRQKLPVKTLHRKHCPLCPLCHSQPMNSSLWTSSQLPIRASHSASRVLWMSEMQTATCTQLKGHLSPICSKTVSERMPGRVSPHPSSRRSEPVQHHCKHNRSCVRSLQSLRCSFSPYKHYDDARETCCSRLETDTAYMLSKLVLIVHVQEVGIGAAALT